jgi:hypothetical protein
VCVDYCRTYYKAVRGGEGGEWRTGTREEPGTLTQGVLGSIPKREEPGSSRLGIEPKTPGWLVQDPTTRPIGDLMFRGAALGIDTALGIDRVLQDPAQFSPHSFLARCYPAIGPICQYTCLEGDG